MLGKGGTVKSQHTKQQAETGGVNQTSGEGKSPWNAGTWVPPGVGIFQRTSQLSGKAVRRDRNEMQEGKERSKWGGGAIIKKRGMPLARMKSHYESLTG